MNYIYGTWQSLVGLAPLASPTDDPAMKRGANWLLSHQHACGGWGESADSYEQPELRGQGPVTASQTAWALLGLMAAGLADHPAVERGIYYLLDTQRADGGWDELEFTGTGFPRVFYLRVPLLSASTSRCWHLRNYSVQCGQGIRRVQSWKLRTLNSATREP